MAPLPLRLENEFLGLNFAQRELWTDAGLRGRNNGGLIVSTVGSEGRLIVGCVSSLQLAGPRGPSAETISRSSYQKDSSVDESHEWLNRLGFPYPLKHEKPK
jgi:hypothetical protein